MSPRLRVLVLPGVHQQDPDDDEVAGEADDSPGLGGIGLILGTAAAVFGYRRLRRLS